MMKREYIGVLDDVMARHRPVPYATKDFVVSVLAEGLLYGAPGLLNDGYLVQHFVLRNMLEQRDPAFLDLLARDWVTVASAIRPPSASIERRARAGVSSHRALVAGDDWPSLAASIDNLPGTQSAERPGWPSRDLTDGFEALARRLRDLTDDGAISNLPGLPSAAALQEFLDAFLNALDRHHDAPRTQWEELAAVMWEEDETAFQAVMDLANLIYHVNVAMLLGADDPASRTVVTRDSPLLAPLLGLKRADDELALPGAPFVSRPSLTREAISAVLKDEGLAAFRDAGVGLLPEAADALADYLDALGRLQPVRDMLVPPISPVRIEGDEGCYRIRVMRVLGGRAEGHLRLTIPQALCNAHAAQAKPFEEGAP